MNRFKRINLIYASICLIIYLLCSVIIGLTFHSIVAMITFALVTTFSITALYELMDYTIEHKIFNL